MLASQIKIGNRYKAKVSNKLVVVQVEDIRTQRWGMRDRQVYTVRNLSTGRVTTFKSGAKFREEVTQA